MIADKMRQKFGQIFGVFGLNDMLHFLLVDVWTKQNRSDIVAFMNIV